MLWLRGRRSGRLPQARGSGFLGGVVRLVAE